MYVRRKSAALVRFNNILLNMITVTVHNISIQQLNSVLGRCWLGSRKGNRLVKTEWWDAVMVM